jgi:hypothetical protein
LITRGALWKKKRADWAADAVDAIDFTVTDAAALSVVENAVAA